MDFAGKDKSQYVKDTFNSIAGKYDFMNTLMSMGMDKYWRKRTVQIVKAKAGMKILDVCCGTGKLTRELAKQVAPAGQVTGIDFSEKMLEEALKNTDSVRKNEITFIQGDAMNLLFENNVFDGATIGWGLRNLPDIKKGIQEMTRVVRPGSMVVSVDMGKPVMPVFKQLYWLCFEKIVPFLGKIWAGKQTEYNYLYSSAREFESQLELKRTFGECGLVNTGYVNLAGGIVAIVYGQKPDNKITD
ncbi:MAG: bifunctional demethylmenaquinone methyltransferase/2-methoxy-6-polyprenyl-1,4-benzoquinol methylase UbiE [Peptococcaceae bacterium]|nr:bifunctional demethylmenaquinone methyltransferase/2-methoxy-6-polyprenyl-1,4-benzoquinol methylase UbiE [Peptococcaceae bacterium]